MAIKSRTTDLGVAGILTEYLYVKCEVKVAKVHSIVWLEESGLHQELCGSAGALNEMQYLEVDDAIPDNVEADELQVDESGVDPDFTYDCSLDSTARQSKYEAALRAERDLLISECEWMAARHRDQTDNSETTDLSGAEYTELLNYRKALRDWPSDELDIYARTAPVKPGFLV